VKQPHEGVSGIDRAGGLLSLEDAAIPYRDALIAVTKHLRKAVLVGNPAPVVEELQQRMFHPEPGDLVVECTRGIYAKDDDTRLKALGIFLERRTEDDGDVWYIQYGPSSADICRWVNSDFFTVPADPHMFT